MSHKSMFDMIKIMAKTTVYLLQKGSRQKKQKHQMFLFYGPESLLGIILFIPHKPDRHSSHMLFFFVLILSNKHCGITTYF